MEQEISLLDLLAAAVRKGKQVIIFAVIVGLLFMGYSYLGAKVSRNEEEEAYAMAEKERELRDLQKTVERAEKGIDAEREYIRDSLYMQLNPYNILNTRIDYQLTDLNVPLDGSLGMMDNPTVYVMDRIIARYLLEWNGTDLTTLLNVPGYQNVEDRYLREVLRVGNGDNGNLYIDVYATSEAEAQKLAEAVEKVVLGLKGDVAKESFGHSLVKVSTVTKQVINETVRDSQNAHYDALDTYVDDLSTAQKSIDKMNSEHTSTGLLKKLIIGCFVGGILAALWVMFRSMVRGCAESAEQVASRTGLKYLGSASSGKERDVFAKLANVITGEKKWGSDAEALSYLAERTAMEGKEKLLVTTTGETAAQGKIDSLLETLKASGIAASYLPAIDTSAETLAALKDVDSVLFAVTKGKSKVPDILAAKQLAEQAGKTAAGYVML